MINKYTSKRENSRVIHQKYGRRLIMRRLGLLMLFLASTILSAEVRPAPHMDNLVSIYKNMEVASGVNIFVTQNLSSTKLSGKTIVYEHGKNNFILLL